MENDWSQSQTDEINKPAPLKKQHDTIVLHISNGH